VKKNERRKKLSYEVNSGTAKAPVGRPTQNHQIKTELKRKRIEMRWNKKKEISRSSPETLVTIIFIYTHVVYLYACT